MTREEAIEQLQNCKDLIKQDGQDYLDERDFPLLDMAIEALSERTGEWVRKDMYASRFCSKCDYAVGTDEAEEYNFCPNCGADMRGEQDE